ncbi:hypothetical protein VCRA2119O147_1090013 [Vibrio crassostreae]|nr:hypothetical protein VCRA2119O147_1090013 [Vibrio crassostreae]CAK2969812.1 hypothetical protein VCRA2110O183_500013 [Vibrio crassostreae]CAK3004084.1 hypothetical protein VCRA2121O264_480012 [Vibrio crassostreae]CAK3711694.1 hypothetical protein VCRA2121O262_500001 [Vibrio crassostreae]
MLMHSIALTCIYQDYLNSSTKFVMFWIDSHNGDDFSFSFGIFIQINCTTVKSNESCFMAF